MSAAYVYVLVAVGDEDDGPCKVGITSRPEARLHSHQSSSHRLVRFAHIDRVKPPLTAREVEQRAHAAMHGAHIRGEWFAVSVMEAVRQIGLAKKVTVDSGAEELMALHPLALATGFVPA